VLNKLNSSLRVRVLNDTINIADRYAKKLGITRVINITPLDRVGIPVYSSTRPDSLSLCVNAGKGLTTEEAYTSAIMEAIEYAYAEQRYNKAEVFFDSFANILIKYADRVYTNDFLLLINKKLNLKENIPWIICKDILNNREVPVPAELILNPFPENLGDQIFGANTNGLASGNNRLEATIHGILEVIEHDIRSFQLIKDTSRIVTLSSLSEDLFKLIEKIKKAGFCLWVRSVENEFGLPFFYCYIMEKGNKNPYFINSGYGCHFSKDIAITRAITEAAQSRLTFIQGSRDDLIFYRNLFSKMTPEEKTFFLRRLLDKAENKRHRINYNSIPERDISESLNTLYSSLIDILKKAGFNRIIRFNYSKPWEKLQVVRVIIPEMESFSNASPKVGKRLLLFFKENKSNDNGMSTLRRA